MKSVVEEGATLIKAFEKAWNKAGKPNKFFVKILEHPVYAFWGFSSKKSAKVALFFKETNEQNAPAMGDDILRQKEYAYLFEDTSMPIVMTPPEPKKQSFKTRPLHRPGNQNNKPAEQVLEPLEEKKEPKNQSSSHTNEGAHSFKGDRRRFHKPHHKKEQDVEQESVVEASNQAPQQSTNTQPDKAILDPGQPRKRYYGRRPYRGNNRESRDNQNKNSENNTAESGNKKQEPNNT